MKQNHSLILRNRPVAAAAVADHLRHALRHLCLLAMGFWLLALPPAQAATIAWQGGGTDMNWSTDANWTNGAPTPTTDVYFEGTGATNSPATPNNVVSTNAVIQSLSLFNETVGTYHTTLINPGVTLTVSNVASSGNVLVGGDDVLAAKVITNYFQGSSGASLVVLATNMSMTVRQQQGSGTKNYALDMSGLDNFTAYMTRIYVAGDGGTRPAGTLLLAKTNLLVLWTTNDVGLKVGYTTGSGMTQGSLVSLGVTNAMFCDYGIGIGLLREGGTGGAILNFNPLTAVGGSAYFRNWAGTGPQSYWLIGDGSSGGYSGNAALGTVDFSLGTIDAQVSQLVVGRNQNSGTGLAAAGAQGHLTLAAGTLGVNTAIIGYAMQNYGPAAIGVVNVDGTAQMFVTNSMQLGRFTAAVTTNGASSAVLNIGTLSSNGSVTVTGNITTTTNANNSGSSSEIHLHNGGSLSVQGSVGPLSVFDLASSTLTFDFGSSPIPVGAVCTVGSLQTAAPLTLNLLGSGLLVGQFPLIQYQTLSGNGGDDFSTVNWPSLIEGYLSNNLANSSIDLVITNVLNSGGPAFSAFGLAGDRNFQMSGTGAVNQPYRILATTNVADPLSRWIEVDSGTFAGSVFSFTDPSSTNYPQRFYRVVTP
jgi:hypothetical protein